MTNEIPGLINEDPAGPALAAPKANKRPKPPPGRHGTGHLYARAAQASTVAASPAPTPKPAGAPEPKATFTPIPEELATPFAPAAEPLARQPPKSKSKMVAKAPGPLSLEETISITAALVALRGPFTIVQIETTGPDPDRDEILAIHALRLDKGAPVAKFRVSTRDQPLQAAVANLLKFLGDSREYVFTHGAPVTQAFLGRAARQHGMLIENPVVDARRILTI